jgi:hypothetical protein
MRTALALLVLVLVLVLAGCDVCDAAARVHLERCNLGDTESCAWLSDHDVGPAGTCPPRG